MADAVHPAVAAEASALILKAMARMTNDRPDTEAMSPERLRWTETWSMLWDASALIDPSRLIGEDAERIAARIAELEAANG